MLVPDANRPFGVVTIGSGVRCKLVRLGRGGIHHRALVPRSHSPINGYKVMRSIVTSNFEGGMNEIRSVSELPKSRHYSSPNSHDDGYSHMANNFPELSIHGLGMKSILLRQT